LTFLSLEATMRGSGDTHQMSHKKMIPWIIGIAVGMAVWISLPPSVTIFNDDFGYVRSIVETLKHGRPWTDEWLEPWAGSLSLLSAVLFKVTGSFRVATYGLQAACAGAMSILVIRLLQLRGLTISAATACSLVLISFPTIVWQIAEFGAMPLYTTCLLAAIWCADRRQWVWFGVFWFTALMSRQSALLWLALPAAALLENPNWRLEWKRIIPSLAGIGLAGALIYSCSSRVMNRTNAQTVMEPALRSVWTLVFLSHLALGLSIFFAAAGLASFLLLMMRRGQPARVLSRNELLLRIIGVSAVVILWAVDARKYIGFEQPLLAERSGGIYLTIACVLSMAGWLGKGFQIRTAYLLTAAAMSALIALRPALWDYYFTDIAVLGLFGVVPVFQIQQWSSLFIRTLVGYGALAALLTFQSTFVVMTKRSVDWAYAVVSLCERSLRAGQIEAADLSVAPFGFRGWHLYPYFVANDGAHGAYIGDFENYVRRDAVRLQTDSWNETPPSITNGKLLEGEKPVATGIFPFGWNLRLRFTLIKEPRSQNSPLQVQRDRYIPDLFPLNDQEWRSYIFR
jgi:hypothetical protein